MNFANTVIANFYCNNIHLNYVHPISILPSKDTKIYYILLKQMNGNVEADFLGFSNEERFVPPGA